MEIAYSHVFLSCFGKFTVKRGQISKLNIQFNTILGKPTFRLLTRYHLRSFYIRNAMYYDDMLKRESAEFLVFSSSQCKPVPNVVEFWLFIRALSWLSVINFSFSEITSIERSHQTRYSFSMS